MPVLDVLTEQIKAVRLPADGNLIREPPLPELGRGQVLNHRYFCRLARIEAPIELAGTNPG